MRTVYKYRIPHPGEQSTELIHSNPKPVLVGQDPNGIFCVWLEVDSDISMSKKTLEVFGTGHPLPAGALHCGSFATGPFVWHVYLHG